MATRNYNAVSRYDKDAVERMAAEGRRPSYDSAGNVRGFRSKPGAAQSPRNRSMGVVTDPQTGLSTATSWARMFPDSPTGVAVRSRQPAVPAQPTGNPDANFGTATGGALPPPEAFAPVPFTLAPQQPPVMTGIADIKPRPGTAPPSTPASMMQQATANNERFLREQRPGYEVFERRTTPQGEFSFLKGKYGTVSTRPAFVAMAEKARNRELNFKKEAAARAMRQGAITSKYQSKLDALISRWST